MSTPMTDIAPVTAASSSPPALSSSSSLPPSASTDRLYYGSIESQLRAGTMKLDNGVSSSSSSSSSSISFPSSSSSSAPAAGAKAPVSFNQRTTLLTSSMIHPSAPAAASSSSSAAADGPSVSSAIRAGMAVGNINISAMSADTFALSASTQLAKEAQYNMMKEIEITKRARSVVVPTNDNQVRKRLREIQEPITLFGERIPGRRERLSSLLARRAVEESLAASGGMDGASPSSSSSGKDDAVAAKKEDKAFLTPGTDELLKARMSIARYSIAKARTRLAAERIDRAADVADASTQHRSIDRRARIARLDHLAHFSSEAGSSRPLSSLAFSPCSSQLATASWSGSAKIYSIAPSTKLRFELKGHKEGVTDVAWNPQPTITGDAGAKLATCAMDSTIKLWAAPSERRESQSDSMDETMDADPSTAAASSSSSSSIAASSSSSTPLTTPTLSALSTLTGHTSRCCRIAYHPSGLYLGSTSYDSTWRLWDLTTSSELLKQSGHTSATYAIAFHPDGSLIATGDLGGVGHLWDLRTGKTVLGLQGHAKQLLAADFHPDGMHLATASDDHTVRIWDLRKQCTLYTIGAHSNLISNVRWEPKDGLYLLTSSYDHTSKIWHGTDFTLIKTLAGHEGRVMRAEIAPNAEFIATSAYDRTWKLYAYEK